MQAQEDSINQSPGLKSTPAECRRGIVELYLNVKIRSADEVSFYNP
jgi:hypothetical protein